MCWVNARKINNFPNFFTRVEDCLKAARTKIAVVRLYRAALIASTYNQAQHNSDTIEDITLKTIAHCIS